MDFGSYDSIPSPPIINLMNIPDQLIRLLQQANHITILTGAGISAESGVPTFREAQTGLWAKYDPQALATPQAFQRDPKLVWEWYAWRRELVTQVKPNPGHFALAQMEKHVPKFTLITQNIDGLHQVAGSKKAIELHGNISRVKCFDDGKIVTNWDNTGNVPPLCPRCGGLLRPDVVWFGENLPSQAITDAFDAARACEIFLSIGTSSVVQPAASLPLEAVQNGAITVEINPSTTPISHYMDFVLAGPSGEILPALVKEAWPS